MDSALIVSAALLGLAGAPHCTVMCSAPCAAAVGDGPGASAGAFHLGRVLGYAAGGAVAAGSVAAWAHWARLSPSLGALWSLAQAAALGLGLWLAWTGKQPAWMGRVGHVPRVKASPVAVRSAGQGGSGAPAVSRVSFSRSSGPMPLRTARAAVAGGLWVAWPCGLLQSGLLVAALTSGAATGAAAMGAFAIASSPGLLFAPWAWRHLMRGGDARARERWAVRAAGALLALSSAWALGHGLWSNVAAFCATL